MKARGKALMQELREDHRNMAIILDMLDNLVGEVEAGNDPDFGLLAEIMRYMTVYPDAVHHPKEDLMYARLRDRRADLTEGLEDVEADHLAIAELGMRLRDDVEAVNAGTAVRREILIADAAKYALRLRSHMQWEEEDLFRRIDNMLDEEPQEFDVTRYAYTKDPVFGIEIESDFSRLSPDRRV